MSQENIIRFLIFILMVTNFSISGYFRRKADRSDEKTTFAEENRVLLSLRNIGALLMYSSILLYLIHPPLLAWAKLVQIRGSFNRITPQRTGHIQNH